MATSAAVRTPYVPSFYSQASGASRSAEVIVPILLSRTKVRSAVDVGCGTGSWLATLQANGVEDVLGIEGEWVQAAPLRIAPERLLLHDLTRPVPIHRRFDLAICLEVAEHLPPTRATSLVEDLTRLAPCVLFSAAVPGQGGTHHVNEQFLSYWVERFEREGFAPLDFIRPLVWSNDQVEWWYRQNIILFAVRDHPILNQDATLRTANDYLHPGLVQSLRRDLTPAPVTLGTIVRTLPGVARASLRSRLGKVLSR